MDIQRDELIGDLQVAGSYPFKSKSFAEPKTFGTQPPSRRCISL